MSKRAQRATWLAAVMTVGALVALPAATAQEVSLIGGLRDAAARTAALCKAADGVREIEPKVARRLYTRALNTGALNTRCAAKGLTALAKDAAARAQAAPTTVDKARALIANGYGKEGDELLRTHLMQQRGASIPRELQPDDRALEAAKALSAQGYETEAQEQVQAALVADPGLTALPTELKKLERKPKWARTAIGWVGGGLVTAAIILAIIGGLVWLVLWLPRVIRSHAQRQIVVEPFEGGSEGAGAALQAEMQDRYHRWTKGSGRLRLAAAAGTDQAIPKPSALIEAVPHAGLLIDLINSLDRFVPNRTWVLAGHFLPADPNQGVGLALTLYRKSNGTVIDADTLRQAEFQALPPTAPDETATKLAYQRLAIAGAAFFLFADRRSRGRGKNNDESHEILGTKIWRSYAMANSAATYYPGQLDVARELYRRALNYDNGYLDARFGMAVIDLQRAAGNARTLKRVEHELNTVATRLPPNAGLWYRARFWRVVTLLYRDERRAARKAAESLFGVKAHWWHADSELAPFLDKHRANMLVILATALARAGRPASGPLSDRLRELLPGLPSGSIEGRDIVTVLENDPERWPAAYNLACYYAFVKPNGDAWIATALRHLETALDAAGPDQARYALNDWSLHSLRTEAGAQFTELVISRAGRRTPSSALASPSRARSNGPAPVRA